MTIWITSDSHINHQKMIEWKLRPENYEQLIINSFKQIKENDTLIHLGDICIGNDKGVHENIIAPIKGRKILVKGNHDHKSSAYYYNHGWDFVCTSFMDKLYGFKLLFTHRPVPWDGICDFNIHGHLHNLGHREDERNNTNIINVLISLETNDYKLVNLQKLTEKLRGRINGKK